MSLRRLLEALCASAIILTLGACGMSGSDGGDGTNDAGSDSTGVAQKGPFKSGGEASATQLNADGTVAENSVAGSVIENGAYQLPEVSWTGATLIELSGTFFDESSGTFSPDERTLRAVAAAGADGLEANVNLYTHFVSARVRALMGSGDTFTDALTQAQDELATIMGIDTPPQELNLLTPAAGTEADSGNLLLFSAASLTAGQGQAEIDAIAADFADDGSINGSTGGSGEAAFEAVRQAALDATLLDSARQNLQAQYAEADPPTGPADVAWMLDACEAEMLSAARVMCENESFEGTSSDDNGEFITFVPLESGHYAIELYGNTTDDNADRCSLALYREADTSSSTLVSTADFCGVEELTSLRLTGEERYYIVTEVTKYDDAGPAATYTLSATRVSEGRASADGAVEVDSVPHHGVVGAWLANTNTSYYKFTAGTGTHTINATGFPCGSGGSMRLNLFVDSGFNDELTHAWESDVCSQTIETDLEAGKAYYLEVENRLGHTESMETLRSDDFELYIETN